MRWEDTVMSEVELLKLTNDLPIVAGSRASARKVFKARSYAKAQAKETGDIAYKRGIEDERERILKYLKVRWTYTAVIDGMTGDIHVVFHLPEDWEQDLKGEKNGR